MATLVMIGFYNPSSEDWNAYCEQYVIANENQRKLKDLSHVLDLDRQWDLQHLEGFASPGEAI